MTREPRPRPELPSEDDRATAALGPRGVPGEPDTHRMTPERKKKTPAENDIAPEHTK
jgi:hypothetical protein